MKRAIAFAIVIGTFCWTLPIFADETAKDTPAKPAQPDAAAAARRAALMRQQGDRLAAVQVSNLYRTGKIEEAEAKLDEALEQYPDSQFLKSLHTTAYMMLLRGDRTADAIARVGKYPDSAEAFATAIGMSASNAARQGGEEAALELLDNVAKQADANETLAAAIAGQKALLLGRAGKADEARAILAEQLTAAEAELHDPVDDFAAIDRVAAVLKAQLALESTIEGGDANGAWAAYSNFLGEQAKAHPDSAAIVGRFVIDHLQRASSLARSDVDQAEAILNNLADFRANAGDSAAISPATAQQIAQLQKSIADTRRREALIGSDAVLPENVVAWVNGEELTPEDLKGKVVLLDFFAVWCGPCVATFPHLRDWHDQYHNDGLEIIGLSNYQKYGWNEDAKRPVRGGAEFTADEEHEAMQQFAAHHELRHPVGFTKDRSLSEHYVVSGIPHVVLIDRQGKVRLFKIGSGEANAHAIEEAIKECLAE